MIYLLASLLLLVCTPLIVQAASRYRRASQVLAFFLILGISYTILTHIIIENMEAYGWGAVIAAVAGVLLLGVGDDYFFSHPEKKSGIFLVLVQIFLFLHAMIDGAALVGSELSLASPIVPAHHHTQELSMSILLHRLLFEVFIWKYFLDRHGKRAALAVLISVAIGTILGFFLSKALFSMIPSYFGLFEAFIGGALLHLVYDYFKERLMPHSRHHTVGAVPFGVDTGEIEGQQPQTFPPSGSLSGDKAETHGNQRPSSPS
jgi:drug/metabolite transporter (DMT)-like permease